MPDYAVAQCLDFTGGQDASKIPDRVSDNAYYEGVNVSTKRGCLAPRWGIQELEVLVSEGGYLNRNEQYISFSNLFASGKFQAAEAIDIAGHDYIVLVIAGNIFLYDVDATISTLVPIDDGSTLNPRATRLGHEVVGDTVVIHDFPNYPIYLKGFAAHRADPNLMETPVSRLGVYNDSRLIVVNGINEFTAGDPVGNILAPEAPLTFQEIMTQGTPYYGQIFQLISGKLNESITAATFLQATDKSTEIGSLVLATASSVHAYPTYNPRSDWQQGQFGSCILFNAGIVGSRACAHANSDLFFMSADGHLRTICMSRQEQGKWAHTPISREVDPWVVFHDEKLKEFGFVTYFNNKVFMSVNPYHTRAIDCATGNSISDVAHAGFVVLELDNVTQLGEVGNPTWAGLWTGINPMDIVTVNEHCYAIGKDNGVNKIYRINPKITYDTAQQRIRYVRSVVRTKEHDCDQPFDSKKIHTLDFNMDEMRGDLSVQVRFKPSHSAKFFDWGGFNFSIPWCSDCLPPDGFVEGYNPQMIRDLRLTARDLDENACQPATEENYITFRKIQFEFIIKAKYWEFHEYRFKAVSKSTSQQDACTTYGTVAEAAVCDTDWVIEPFDYCLPVCGNL